MKEVHESKVLKVGKGEHLHFPNFLGFNCVLRGSKLQAERYYVTEASQPEQSNHDNLSETCYFFIPEHVMKLHLDLKTSENIEIPIKKGVICLKS